MKLCDYKDHAIDVSNSGTFTAEGIIGSFDTFERMQAKIDAETKIKYKPVDGFVFGNGRWSDSNEITEVKVMRPHGDPSRKEFWISDANKKRSTTVAVYRCTPENRAIAAKMIENRKAAKALSIEYDKLARSLDSNFILEQV